MTKESCNCIICSREFAPDDLQNVVLSEINTTPFKVCEACLDYSNPMDNYLEVRNIVNSYLKFAQAKHLFSEVSAILYSRKDND
jgi:hypothetical protein